MFVQNSMSSPVLLNWVLSLSIQQILIGCLLYPDPPLATGGIAVNRTSLPL